MTSLYPVLKKKTYHTPLPSLVVYLITRMRTCLILNLGRARKLVSAILRLRTMAIEIARTISLDKTLKANSEPTIQSH